MRKSPEKPSDISQEDWDAVDVPEATAEDFARARPFKEVFPEQYKAWKRMGRPPVESPKVHISFRLASDVVDGIRATGQGYNTRVEEVLRDALKRGDLNSQRNLPSAAVPERISERRAQLREQLDELEIAERVLRRFGRQSPTAVSLSDATLRAVQAHGGSATAQEIRDYLSREFGMTVNANRVGVVLHRHRRAGRLIIGHVENRRQRWYSPTPAETTTRSGSARTKDPQHSG